jgi:hypothetical protein
LWGCRPFESWRRVERLNLLGHWLRPWRPWIRLWKQPLTTFLFLDEVSHTLADPIAHGRVHLLKHAPVVQELISFSRQIVASPLHVCDLHREALPMLLMLLMLSHLYDFCSCIFGLGPNMPGMLDVRGQLLYVGTRHYKGRHQARLPVTSRCKLLSWKTAAQRLDFLI